MAPTVGVLTGLMALAITWAISAVQGLCWGHDQTKTLLDLATELKQYVDKTNENIISLDVIKKAEQIEKLAKSVKDKMKGQ